ncbi:MAG: ABC transporter permease [Paracoccaceae bacterium]
MALRNRWVLIATALMVLFALALTLAGSAPTGVLGVDLLTVSVASMATLSVYLLPLLALLMAFDAVAAEQKRGTLALLLTYPLSRGELLAGKMVAHLAALAIAVFAGFGSAGAAAWALGGADGASLAALFRLGWSPVPLGGAFLAIGYAVSALARAPGEAAGMAIGIWIVFVVLYDLGLLGALVFDDGGTFSADIFRWLLAANPADAFRIFNLSGEREMALISGLAGASDALPGRAYLTSLLVWPFAGLALARAAIKRLEP